jgi:hypothetical protein
MEDIKRVINVDSVEEFWGLDSRFEALFNISFSLSGSTTTSSLRPLCHKRRTTTSSRSFPSFVEIIRLTHVITGGNHPRLGRRC